MIDVVDRRVAVPSIDLDEPFELDDYTQHRLLNGLDDIGLTEQRGDAITTFEAESAHVSAVDRLSRVIRAATAADGPVLREIEIAAGARFATVGLDRRRRARPVHDRRARHVRGRRAQLGGDRRRRAPSSGYAVADVLDGCGHLEQVSVRPGASRAAASASALVDAVAHAGRPTTRDIRR